MSCADPQLQNWPSGPGMSSFQWEGARARGGAITSRQIPVGEQQLSSPRCTARLWNQNPSSGLGCLFSRVVGLLWGYSHIGVFPGEQECCPHVTACREDGSDCCCAEVAKRSSEYTDLECQVSVLKSVCHLGTSQFCQGVWVTTKKPEEG